MDYILYSTDGEFSLYVRPKVYKTYVISEGGYIRNIITGENCGQKVELCCQYYAEDGSLLNNPIYDVDCYEYVYE